MLTKHGDHEALLISIILIYTTSLIALIRMINTKNDKYEITNAAG